MKLLGLWTRPRREAETQEADLEVEEADLEAADSPAGGNRLLLLVPDGGFSFRLFAFPSIESAQTYLHTRAIPWRQANIVVYWVLESESASTIPSMPNQTPEALVMIRNPSRPGVIRLYSFIGMEEARAFLGESKPEGLDPNFVLLYWATRVTLDESPAAHENQQSLGPTSLHVTAGPPELAPSPSESLVDTDMQHRSAGTSRGSFRPAAETLGKPSTIPVVAEDHPDLVTRDRRGASPINSMLARVYWWQGWDGLAVRMLAASLLRPEVYQDLRQDAQATGRAALIVGLGVLATGLGAAGSGLASAFWHAFAVFAGWAICVCAIYLVGTWLLRGRAESLPQLFQAAGLATSPALLLFLGAVPTLGSLLSLAILVWVAGAMAIAAMSILELSRESAFLTAVVGWLAFFAISLVAPAVLLS